MSKAAKVRGENRMLYMWMVCFWGKPHASRIGTESVLQTLQGSPSARVLIHMSQCSVAQLSPSLCDPMDCSLPGSSVHGIFQTRVLEWVAISFFRYLPSPCIKPVSPESPALAGGFFTRVIREALGSHTQQPCYSTSHRLSLSDGEAYTSWGSWCWAVLAAASSPTVSPVQPTTVLQVLVGEKGAMRMQALNSPTRDRTCAPCSGSVES